MEKHKWIVPIVLFLVVQAGGIVWWGSGINSDVVYLKSSMSVLSERVEHNESDIQEILRDLAVLNNTVQSLNENLKETNQLLRQRFGYITPDE